MRVQRLAAAVVCAAAAGGVISSPAAADPGVPTVTRWAYAQDGGPVVKEPGRSGGLHGVHLRLLTSDGFPQPYLVLGERGLTEGSRWVRIRVPGRPNGRTGWVQRTQLGEFHSVRTAIVVDRRRHRLTLYRAGRRIMRVPVGVGKAGTPTPVGHFWITERLRVDHVPAYGPYALGTSAYAAGLTDWPGGGVVGLHGTDQPGLIPGAPSHGCIRLRNADIARLYRRVQIGTPIDVR